MNLLKRLQRVRRNVVEVGRSTAGAVQRGPTVGDLASEGGVARQHELVNIAHALRLDRVTDTERVTREMSRIEADTTRKNFEKGVDFSRRRDCARETGQ